MTHFPAPALVMAALSLAIPAAPVHAQEPIQFNGFAAASGISGGAGKRDCVVHDERSLRGCLRGDRYVRFESDVDIELSAPLILDSAANNTTIDGRGYNVTFRVPPGTHHHLFLLKRQLDNFVVVNVRLVGNFEGVGPIGNGIGLFELDGRDITRVAIIDSTFKGDPDGAPQPWCGNKNITFEGILVMDSYHPFGHGCSTPILDPAAPRARTGITTYRSVFARNGERQPQLREGVYDYDFVSNIVYDWRDYDPRPNEVAGYGMLLRDGVMDSINIIGNAFLPGEWREPWGCVVGTKPGADKGSGGLSPSEEGLQKRSIYFAREGTVDGNVGGPDCQSFDFRLTEPNPRPYALPTVRLTDVVDRVGAQPRTADERSLLDEIRSRLQ